MNCIVGRRTLSNHPAKIPPQIHYQITITLSTYFTRTSDKASVIMTGSDRSRRLLEAPAKVWADGSRVTIRFFFTSDDAGAAALVVVFLVVVVGAAGAGIFGRGSSGRVAKMHRERETVLRDLSGQRYGARAEGVRQEDLIRPRRRSEFRLASASFSNHSLPLDFFESLLFFPAELDTSFPIVCLGGWLSCRLLW